MTTQEMVGVDFEALAPDLGTMTAEVTMCCASSKDNESLPSLEPLSPLQAGSDTVLGWIYVSFCMSLFMCVFVIFLLHTFFQHVFFAYFPLRVYSFLLFVFEFWFVTVREVLSFDRSLTFLPSP